MNNEPVAWIDKNTGKPRMEGFIQTDHDIPLYTHPSEHDLGIAEAIGFEKGHKSAEDMLRQQQAEIEALKKQMPDWENINKPNPFIGWENQVKDLNPNSGLGGVALRKAQEK